MPNERKSGKRRENGCHVRAQMKKLIMEEKLTGQEMEVSEEMMSWTLMEMEDTDRLERTIRRMIKDNDDLALAEDRGGQMNDLSSHHASFMPNIVYI